MFMSQTCLSAALLSMAPRPCGQLSAKDTDMEQALHYVTMLHHSRSAGEMPYMLVIIGDANTEQTMLLCDVSRKVVVK